MTMASELPAATPAMRHAIEADVYVPAAGKYAGYVLLHIHLVDQDTHLEIPFTPENSVRLASHLSRGAVQALRQLVPVGKVDA